MNKDNDEVEFNFDLDRMKHMVENQKFIEVPEWALENTEEFTKWLELVNNGDKNGKIFKGCD